MNPPAKRGANAAFTAARISGRERKFVSQRRGRAALGERRATPAEDLTSAWRKP